MVRAVNTPTRARRAPNSSSTSRPLAYSMIRCDSDSLRNLVSRFASPRTVRVPRPSTENKPRADSTRSSRTLPAPIHRAVARHDLRELLGAAGSTRSGHAARSNEHANIQNRTIETLCLGWRPHTVSSPALGIRTVVRVAYGSMTSKDPANWDVSLSPTPHATTPVPIGVALNVVRIS